MSTNIDFFPPFKYFDNSFTLFQIVEFYFPDGDHIDRTSGHNQFDISNKHKKNSIPDLFVAAEKERLNKYYPSLYVPENIRHTGFVCKIMGYDWPQQILAGEFYTWKETVIPDLIKMGSRLPKFLKTCGIKTGTVEEYLECKFFELLACGVNDALYLDELNNFKAHNENINNTDSEAIIKKAGAAKHSSSVIDTEKRVLLDIWKPSKDHYTKVIAFLENDNYEIDRPLIKNNRWIGYQTYLRGFINVCKKKSFIDTDELDIIQLEKIINNTFGTKLFKSDAFKGFFHKRKMRLINGEKKDIEDPWEKPFLNLPL